MPNSKRKNPVSSCESEEGNSTFSETKEKRPRNKMSTLSQHDSELLLSMSKQVKKLDLLEGLIRDVTDLKAAVNLNNNLIEELSKENKSLKMTVNNLTLTTEEIQKENKRIKSELLDLKCRSMRNNIVIMGLNEEENETYLGTERLVKQFMKQNLKMSDEQVQGISVERAHRFGRRIPSKPRPIVAKLSDHKMKMSVLQRGKELKGTLLSVNDQFPPEIIERRRILYPIFKQRKAQNIKTRLVVDKLYVNDQLFRDSSITPWLF